MISDYLESLGGALSFDRSLSRSVRREVEDHLWEAVAADSAGDGLEAQRRAIARFGDPHVIAAQFAVVSLARRTRRVGAAVILAIAGIFVTMKARVAWYALMQWAVNDDMRGLSETVGLVDRYAFWLSVFIGIATCAYISARPVPASLHPGYRKDLRRFVLLCTAATVALGVSVTSDGVLTAIALLANEFCRTSLIPACSVAIEIACAGILVFQIRAVTRRATSTAALLKT